MAPGLGSILSRLMGAGGSESERGEPAADAPVEYKGYQIQAAPRPEGSLWFVAGTIAKTSPEGLREHYFIRADSYSSREGAAEFTVMKAKQMIDLEGDQLFDK